MQDDKRRKSKMEKEYRHHKSEGLCRRIKNNEGNPREKLYKKKGVEKEPASRAEGKKEKEKSWV